ncbi:MAG: FGGY-family carbohydrate kinase [Anaerolineae bacterium]
MAEEYILAIDQGTTNTKVILVDQDGEVVKMASQPVDISFPQAAWVEQDAAAVWQSVTRAIDACLKAAGNPGLIGVAVSNQRESGIAWERSTGKPVGPLVSWQCRRTTPLVAALRTPEFEAEVLQRTGLVLDPMFTAAKFRWLLDHTPDGKRRAADGDICVGTVDSWLLWNLTGGRQHRTDMSNASRTELFNIDALAWDETLLDTFGVPLAALPEVRPSASVFGETVALGRLPAGLPVASMIGDSHAALFGHAGFEPGAVKATHGTGSSLMTPTRRRKTSQIGLSSTVAWGAPDATYALEGNITVTGAAVQWLSDLLGLGAPGKVAELAEQVESSDGVYFVPAFAGLGAPHWDDAARGTITGLTRGTTPQQVSRAVIESIAYQIRDVFDGMQRECDSPIHMLLADGGVTRNRQLMQFEADILGVPVQRNNTPELSALGAAYLAGLTLGCWESKAVIASLPRSIDRFEPQMPPARREALYAGWCEAVERTKYHPRQV